MIYYINHGLSIAAIHPGDVEFLFTQYISDDVLIISDAIVINESDYLKIVDLVNSDKRFNKILFDASTNAVNPIERLNTINQVGFNKPIIVTTSLIRYNNNPTPHESIRYFPFWTLWSATQGYQFSDHPKKYRASCLNGSYWNHRILTYLLLSKRNYFNELVFSFGHRDNIQDVMTDLQLTSEEWEQYQQLPPSVEFNKSDATIGIDISINHPAYLETYINLVTETNIRGSTAFVSEKTFKPIRAGQLFVLVAAKGAVQYLRDIGLDTFDDVIDHSYDLIADDRARIAAAIESLDQLMKLDLEKVFGSVKSRLISNAKYFNSDEFKQQFLVKMF